MGCVNWRGFLARKLRLHNPILKEALAEFIGVFILISFGNGSVAQYVLGRGRYGTFLSVNWCWGLGVAMAVFASGGVSGGHINPAVSLAQSVRGVLPWIKLPFYIVAQYLGAFMASVFVYAVYHDALDDFDGGIRQVTGPNATAGIWATYPQEYLSTMNAFGDQIFGTGLLMIGILSITDPRNMAVPKHMVPLCVGLCVHIIGASFGVNCGYAINPARDLGPRIFTAMAGWGVETFSVRNYNYFWVPVLGPHLGAILGAGVYHMFIANHWETDDEEELKQLSVAKYKQHENVNPGLELEDSQEIEKKD